MNGNKSHNKLIVFVIPGALDSRSTLVADSLLHRRRAHATGRFRGIWSDVHLPDLYGSTRLVHRHRRARSTHRYRSTRSTLSTHSHGRARSTRSTRNTHSHGRTDVLHHRRVVQHERREKKQTMHYEEMPEHEVLLDTTNQIRIRTLDIGCDIIRQLRVRTVC